jgi:hypothetical protein
LLLEVLVMKMARSGSGNWASSDPRLCWVDVRCLIFSRIDACEINVEMKY